MVTFSLGTVTYPVARGIRVELAGIILICIVGVLSQFKLWKVIKRRRKRQAAAQQEARRRRDEADAETGKRIEKETKREMLRWEATYGRWPTFRQQHYFLRTDIIIEIRETIKTLFIFACDMSKHRVA